MHIANRARLVGVGVACAAIGAGSGAVINASAHGNANHATRAGQFRAYGHRHFGRARFGGRVVHADLVVAQSGGTFSNATVDRGFVTAVSGNQLTIREGTVDATYKTVTLTIPSSARVRVNGQQATLADVKTGQHVNVLQGPNATFVGARDARMGSGTTTG